MKPALPFLFILMVQFGFARQAPSTDSLSYYNKILSAKTMKSDLALFRDIRDKMNSGLYRYRTKKQIDSIYRLANKRCSKDMRTIDFFKVILELTDYEGSCHNYTEVNPELIAFLNRQRAFFPYALKYVEGKMLFNNKDAPVPLGAAIISINGVSDSVLQRSFYKYMTADGYTVTEKLSGSVNNSFGLRYIFEYGIADSFVVRFIPHGTATPQTVTVPAVYKQDRDKNVEARHSIVVDNITDYKKQPSYSFKKIDTSTALLNFRIFSMASGADDPAFAVYARYLDSVFRSIDKEHIQNLIIDVRGNPGGSDPTFEEPMMYLTDSDFKENSEAYIVFDKLPYEQYFFGISTSEKMVDSVKAEGLKMIKDQFPLLKNGKNLQHPKYNPVYRPKSPQFRGKVYMLIDERVASAASHFASLLKGYGRDPVIVGVETVGGYYVHNGHIPTVYELPGSKIKTKFSIVHVVQDAPVKPDQPDGRGILPNHEVWPTYDDFINNRDGQMEFVLKLIREGK